MDCGVPQWLDGHSSGRKIIGALAKFRDESCPQPFGFPRSLGRFSVSLVPFCLYLPYFCAELDFFGIKCADKSTQGIQVPLSRELACGRSGVGVCRAPNQWLVEATFLITGEPGKRYQPCAQPVATRNQGGYVIGQDRCCYCFQEWIHAGRDGVYVHCIDGGVPNSKVLSGGADRAHYVPLTMISAPTSPFGNAATIFPRCSCGANRSSPRQYRSRRQNGVLPLPWPGAACSSDPPGRSAGSGAQMMLRPGRRRSSRSTTSGSLQITRRRIHNLGSERLASGWISRPEHFSSSSCLGIDPLAKVVGKGASNIVGGETTQNLDHHTDSSVWPSFGKDRVQTKPRRPRPGRLVLDQKPRSAKLPHGLAPRTIGRWLEWYRRQISRCYLGPYQP